MVRFRVAEHEARGEFMVEAYVPSCGNDAALIAVFNSRCAAEKFSVTMEKLADIAVELDHLPVPQPQRDPQDD